MSYLSLLLANYVDYSLCLCQFLYNLFIQRLLTRCKHILLRIFEIGFWGCLMWKCWLQRGCILQSLTWINSIWHCVACNWNPQWLHLTLRCKLEPLLKWLRQWWIRIRRSLLPNRCVITFHHLDTLYVNFEILGRCHTWLLYHSHISIACVRIHHLLLNFHFYYLWSQNLWLMIFLVKFIHWLKLFLCWYLFEIRRRWCNICIFSFYFLLYRNIFQVLTQVLLFFFCCCFILNVKISSLPF